MKTFYFGPTTQKLFGIYHAPMGTSRRGTGVVLCNPMGFEYMWSHRAMRQLAVRLSRTGFPVLRFDYYGCGDSGGEDTDGHVEQWITDIGIAIDELVEISGVSRVSLVGLRLGGSIGLLVGSRTIKGIESLVLWEPILNGKAYLDRLGKLQEDWERRHGLPLVDDKDSSMDENGSFREVVGFPITKTNQRSLQEIDLLRIDRKPAEGILVLRNDSQPEDGAFIERLNDLGGKVERQVIVGRKVWVEEGIDGRVHVPYSVLKAIVDWLCKTSQ
ncbi:MAG: alpha/beta hydrolase [Terriglobia bacterium]